MAETRTDLEPDTIHADYQLHSQGSADGDSGHASDSTSYRSSASTSLASSVLDYQYENGRRYHAFNAGAYPLPNDEAEQERLDLHHHIFRLALDGALLRAPIDTNKVTRALDIGTGTGIWAIDFADEHEAATVIGTDISPIQPAFVPPNCSFYIEDCESAFHYGGDEALDLIHARGLGGSVGDWPAFYARVLDSLRPGGWCEMQEYEAWVHSETDPGLERSPNLDTLQKLCDEASTKFGKKMNVATEQKGFMAGAGFEEVRDYVVKIPIGPWAKGGKNKTLGKLQREHMCASLEPFTLALLTRVMGWSYEATMVLLAGVRKEFCDPANHLISVFHFVQGRKKGGAKAQ